MRDRRRSTRTDGHTLATPLVLVLEQEADVADGKVDVRIDA
jgi:hypothetical protein